MRYLFKSFQYLFVLKRQPKHYNSIDAPVFIWNKVHETSDLSWLLIERKQITEATKSLLQKVWETIYSEFIAAFGFSDNFLSIEMKKKEIALMQCDLIINRDRTLLTFIEIAEEELQDLQKQLVKSNFMDSKIAIEKHFKFQLNIHTTSIREFYSYLKNISKR